jgi:hypothetical protein
VAWPRAPAVRQPVLWRWSLPVAHGAEEGALRGRCEGRKMVLRSAEDEEGRGGGMPAAWSLAWPAMAVTLRHKWRPATHAGAVGRVRPRAYVTLRQPAARLGKGRAAASSVRRPAMATRGHHHAQREPRGRERGGGRRVSARTRFSPSEATERSAGQQGTRPCRWGHEQGMAATRSATRRPMRQFNEHLAGVGEDEVGSQIGPLPDRISLWAKKQSCSSQYALQFLFGGHSHW